MGDTATSRRSRRIPLLIALLAYLAIVVASNVSQSTRPEPPVSRPSLTVPEQRGPLAGSRQIRMTYLEWAPVVTPTGPTVPSGPDRPAVILLHGSPGDASNFQSTERSRGLGELLSARGYRVLAPDLPGFGQSEKRIPDYSIRAHAAYTLALMDALAIDRAHVVGWSMGGGAVLHMADDAPDRIASATLMASIGTQESEGSGDYWFEHSKYALGYAAGVVGRDAFPHFGLLGPRWLWRSWMRNFWDTDQRPLRDILRRSRTPLLILHGRYDVLAGIRGAEEAAALSPVSRLVVTDDNHFLPVLQAQEMTTFLSGFFDRHDQPGVVPLPGAAILAPPRPTAGADAILERSGRVLPQIPWWALAAIIALLASRRPRATVMLAALPIAAMTLDFGVASVGILAGWAWQERFQRRGAAWIRLLLWIPTALLLSFVAAAQLGLDWVERWSWLGLIAFITIGAILLAILPNLWTWRGHRRLLASWSRLTHHEWWPANLFYLPLWPWCAWLSLRHGGPLAFTAANPGIPGGGGLIGESKSQILGCIGPDASHLVLPVRLIRHGPSPDQRADEALAAIRESGPDGDFALPVILKPDMAFRGFALRLARAEADVRSYFHAVTSPVILQKFHPGPEECGLFWVRTLPPADLSDPDALAGRIFAVTRKRFPSVVGDGRRTLERIILDHPRLRCQWRVFCARHRARLHEVLPAGQRLRLAQAGNHAQGTLFLDGADLVTPALSRVVDRICASYRDAHGRPYDFGRMDVRYESDDLLRQGEAFGVVELNGSTSEATNLYDPSFSLMHSYSILFAQWRILYELGAWRRAQGFPGVGAREIARHWIEYQRQRSGSSIAD